MMSQIRVNQIGYLPLSSKTATLDFCPSGLVLARRTEGGEAAWRGNAAPARWDDAAGETVYPLNFTSLCAEGSYFLEADGVRSAMFSIGQNVYDALFSALQKALYFQRCGTALPIANAGVYSHPACHERPAQLWENRKINLDVSGGWHDAGDYGRYVVPGCVAVSHLLTAYELFPAAPWRALNLPETGNGVPDALNECRYELEWLLKMQTADGGVYHKATTRLHADFVMPQSDDGQLFVFPVSSTATADFAAVMAQASRIYRRYDDAFSMRMLLAAQRAYAWLRKNPRALPAHNPQGCNTGEYDDECDADERCWAAEEMYKTSGEASYHQDFLATLASDFDALGESWSDVGMLATIGYLVRNPRILDPNAARRLTASVKERLKEDVFLSLASPHGVAFAPKDYIWGSNMQVALRGALMALFAPLADDRDLTTRCAWNQLHYLLGNNAMDTGYVTGFGKKAYARPHLRTAEADGVEAPMPGWLSGGPNGTPADPTAIQTLGPHTPPMKCYVDHPACYSLNEVTIYWNSSAVLMLAALQDDSSKPYSSPFAIK